MFTYSKSYYILKSVFNAFGEYLTTKPILESPHIYCVKNNFNNNIIKTLHASLLLDFHPSKWAPGPYSQTLANLLFVKKCHEYTRREIIHTIDGVELFLDWKEPPHSHHAHAPIVVICHGIAGDSSSTYPIRLSDLCYNANYHSVIYNRRGHANASIFSNIAKGYPIHCDTLDLHTVAMHLKHTYPNNILFIAGTSAGGNVIAKYLAQYKSSQPFKAAAISACAFNIHALVNTLKLSSNPKFKVADALLRSSLIEMMDKRTNSLLPLAASKNINIDINKIKEASSVYELETLLTLPFYKSSFKSIDDYYIHQSSHATLIHINIPTLIMNSIDDILIPHEFIDNYPVHAAFNNSNIITLVTKQGGHAAWLKNLNQSWDIDLTLKYFQSFYTPANEFCNTL